MATASSGDNVTPIKKKGKHVKEIDEELLKQLQDVPEKTLKDILAKAMDVEKERSVLNQSMNALRTEVKNLGFEGKAFNALIQRAKSDKYKRELIDASLSVLCEKTGVVWQQKSLL